MRQLTVDGIDTICHKFSKLPMRQLTHCWWCTVRRWFSKLPMRQLTTKMVYTRLLILSKLPMRQLTVVFYANILMLLKLAADYSYLTKILGSCQSPWFTRPASNGKFFGQKSGTDVTVLNPYAENPSQGCSTASFFWMNRLKRWWLVILSNWIYGYWTLWVSAGKSFCASSIEMPCRFA